MKNSKNSDYKEERGILSDATSLDSKLPEGFTIITKDRCYVGGSGKKVPGFRIWIEPIDNRTLEEIEKGTGPGAKTAQYIFGKFEQTDFAGRKQARLVSSDLLKLIDKTVVQERLYVEGRLVADYIIINPKGD